MAPGARSKFGAPIFETDVFHKQLFSVEESTFGAPRSRPYSDSVPGKLFFLTPSIRPWCWVQQHVTIVLITQKYQVVADLRSALIIPELLLANVSLAFGTFIFLFNKMYFCFRQECSTH